MSQDENKWESNITFILAMIGAAVGLGNIWRYPYVLYSNGGGAFLIPYLIAICIMSMPFLILEYGVGYNFKSSFTKAITHINPKFEFYGWLLPITTFIMTIYYSTVISWDGIYVILSFFKGWGSNPDTFLTSSVLHSSNNIIDVLNFVPIIAISIITVWFLIWFISHKKLESGIGKVARIFIPTLFIIMLTIVLYSLTLPGAYIGVNTLLKPDWALLLNFKIWLVAFGQTFFSLNLGMGTAFTFSGYSKDDTDLATNALCVILANSLFENIAALGVFSVLGYMSLQSGMPITDLVSEGIGLTFVVYPTVFNLLGQIALIIGPLFFIATYLAGITSILSSFEVLSISIQDKFYLSRKKAVLILCIIGGIFSMIYATSPGQFFVGVTDTFVNSIVLVFSVIIELIIFTWIFKAEKLINFLNSKSKTIKLGKIWLNHVKYIIPVLLSIIWIGGMYSLILDSSTTYVILLLILFAILMSSTLILTKLPAKSKDWYKIKERISTKT